MDLERLTFAGYGLLAGLLVAAWGAFRAWQQQRALSAEVLRLREHLNTQMEVTNDGNVTRNRQLEQLRLENERLRIAVQTWRQKPDRRELRLLQVYDQALHQLLENTPGFSVHWHSALREAELHVAEADRGLLAFTRRWLLPAGRTRRSTDSEKE